jgi:hypothetical protein
MGQPPGAPMKRRPQPSGALPPERLMRFVAEEWQPPTLPEHASDWQREHWHRLGPVHAWINARRIWSADHGDVLGNFVERFCFEVDIRRAQYAAVHREVGQCRGRQRSP